MPDARAASRGAGGGRGLGTLRGGQPGPDRHGPGGHSRGSAATVPSSLAQGQMFHLKRINTALLNAGLSAQPGRAAVLASCIKERSRTVHIAASSAALVC